MALSFDVVHPMRTVTRPDGSRVEVEGGAFMAVVALDEVDGAPAAAAIAKCLDRGDAMSIAAALEQWTIAQPLFADRANLRALQTARWVVPGRDQFRVEPRREGVRVTYSHCSGPVAVTVAGDAERAEELVQCLCRAVEVRLCPFCRGPAEDDL